MLLDNPISKLQKFLSNELDRLDTVLKSRVHSRKEAIQIISEYIFSAGGKRIRPILTILCAKLFAYEGDRHINLAASVELIHTATLLHDDVVDESNMRRGKPTANKKWDNKICVLVGDFLFSQAFCLMAEDGDLEVLKILSKASAIIAEGEVMQAALEQNLSLTSDEYFQVIESKTGELFAASCAIGGIVSNGTIAEQQALKNFGKNLGIAFQIIDDLLDYSAKQKGFGKNLGDDFKEGKVTLPIIIAYKQSNEEEKDFWYESFVKLKQNKDSLSKAIKILKKYDIFTQTKEIANSSIISARNIIEDFPKSDAQTFLLELLDFSIDREY